MKKGLDYFSFDVDFFEDEKIQYVSSRFGIKGEVCAIRLLTRLYRDGYFLRWDVQDSPYLFAKVAGKEFTTGLVKGIVDELVRRGFFNESLLHSFGILTSHGIQTRYLKACARRKVVEIDERYLLVDPLDFKNLRIGRFDSCTHFSSKCIHDVDIKGENVDISGKNVDISKQSKVKESKYTTTTTTTADRYAEAIQCYQDNIRPISGGIELEKVQALIDEAGTDLFVKAVDRAVFRDVRNLQYITGILRDWMANGYDEEGDGKNGGTAKSGEQQRPARKTHANASAGRKKTDGSETDWDSVSGWE